MKKSIDKLVISILIFVIVFNYIYMSFSPVLATGNIDIETITNVTTTEELEALGIKAGEAMVAMKDLITNFSGGAAAIYLRYTKVIALAIAFSVNTMLAEIAYIDNKSFTPDNLFLTPFDIFFNEVQLLDINFFDLSAGGTTGILRTQVAKWYYIIRNIAVSILLLILVYLGIRMAISSVASEKALYKRSLLDWVYSLGIVFLLHYFMVFVLNINSVIVEVLKHIIQNDSVGSAILQIAILGFGISWQALAAIIVYCIIVFQTAVFFVKYVKRMLTVAFLIVISPLISITYSIDKMGDKQSQTLNSWIKEFVFNVIMQPFHCIMYVVFVDTSFGLLLGNGSVLSQIANMIPISTDPKIASSILAIICLLFLKDGEKIIRKIFNFGEASTVSPLETAAMAGVVAKGGKLATEGAKNARKGINTIKEKGASAKESFSQLGNNIKTNKMANSILKENKAKGDGKMTKAQAVTKAKDKIKQQKAEKIQKMKQAQDAKKESKVQRQMKKDLGNEKYQALVDGRKNPKIAGEYAQAREAAIAKVNERSENRNRKINGIKNAWNSDTGKFVRKLVTPSSKSISAGVAMALGGMSLDGTNIVTAMGTASAAYKGSEEFFKTSTNRITSEAVNYAEGDVSNKEELKEKTKRVYQNADSYNDDSDKTQDLIRKLEEALSKLNKADSADNIQYAISKELLKSPKDFNLDGILEKYVGKDCKDEELNKAASAYANHKKDGYFYEQIEKAASVGISLDSLVNNMDKKMNYSTTEKISENINEIESSNSEIKQNENTSNSTTENGEINSIITNIQKSENIEEVITKIDSSDYDRAISQIIKHINELNQMNSESENVNTEIRKMASAVIKLRDMKNNLDE